MTLPIIEVDLVDLSGVVNTIADSKVKVAIAIGIPPGDAPGVIRVCPQVLRGEITLPIIGPPKTMP